LAWNCKGQWRFLSKAYFKTIGAIKKKLRTSLCEKRRLKIQEDEFESSFFGKGVTILTKTEVFQWPRTLLYVFCVVCMGIDTNWLLLQALFLIGVKGQLVEIKNVSLQNNQ
jgi:hypothetical protein